MKTVANLRKRITEGIMNGSIKETHVDGVLYEGSYLQSGTRAYLSREKCLQILEDGYIDYGAYPKEFQKAIYSKNKRRNIFSEPLGSNGSGGSGSGSNSGSNSGSGSGSGTGEGASSGTDTGTDTGTDEGACEPPVSDIDYKLISDKGLKSLEEVKTDLGVDVGTKVEEKINDLSQQIQNEYLDTMSKVNKVVDDVKKQVGATKVIDVKINDKVVTKKGVIYHPEFAKITYYAKQHRNVLLVGGAGSGKTTLAEQVADALGLRFGSISCTAGMNESQLMGRPALTLNGKNGYIGTQFVDIYENGGVFLLDEYDALDSNMACSVNSGLANGILSVPNRMDNPIAKRHKDCIVIACGNTWGTGQGSRHYVGRNKIDGATLDRFVPIEVDYDDNLERHLVGEHIVLYDFLNHLRKACANKGIDKIISTRLFVNGAKDFSNKVAFDGRTVLGTFANTITLSWTRREKDKIGFDEIVEKYENQ